MGIGFLYGEMLNENREIYSYEPGMVLNSWLTETVNILSAPTIAGIYGL